MCPENKANLGGEMVMVRRVSKSEAPSCQWLSAAIAFQDYLVTSFITSFPQLNHNAIPVSFSRYLTNA